ncbi:syntaxin-5 [Passer montanus]|uniref:syntaxin-5 n=1 Tax=Passer montanus TaxID=9160 RepID=UPI00196194D2|nr:syntaxin-5 [Passer montanus]
MPPAALIARSVLRSAARPGPAPRGLRSGPDRKVDGAGPAMWATCCGRGLFGGVTGVLAVPFRSRRKGAQLRRLPRAAPPGRHLHLHSHSDSVVVSLQSKLASMSNDFKSVLEVRTENLKQQRSRREHFSRAPVSALAANNLTSPAVLQAEPPRPGAVAIEMDSRTSQQLQLLDEQDSYIQSRADTMQNIESTIVELGSIFQQLAHMVKEQEETIQRIDSSVEDAQLNVEAAHGEILKYFHSVTSNRWLMGKIFLILIVFFIVFVVFLA